MEAALNIDNVNALIEEIQASTEEAIENESSFSPMMTRAKRLVKNAIPDNFNKVKSSAITMLKGKKLSPKIDEEDPSKKVTITINWIISILKDLFRKVNNQGELIAEMMSKLLDLAEPKEGNEDCDLKLQTLEKQLNDKAEVVEKTLVESHEALEAKIHNLELQCDETRQRSLKVNLIVICPRVSRGDVVADTMAVRDRSRNSVRKESDTEMVVRLVRMKTGQAIPLQDISACHPIGRKESNTFILRVTNRKPGSAWDTITTGMRRGFASDDNIYINYQLTDRRIALSKEVKQAKQA